MSVPTQWASKFKKALSHDQWGQVVEAKALYNSLGIELMENSRNSTFDSDVQDVMKNIALCISARIQAIKTFSSNMTYQDLESILPSLESIGAKNISPIPLPSQKYSNAPVLVSNTPGVLRNNGENGMNDSNKLTKKEEEKSGGNGLVTVRTTNRDSDMGTKIKLHVLHFDLKDAANYVNPFLMVQLFDGDGKLLETCTLKETGERDGHQIFFDDLISFQTTHEKSQTMCCFIIIQFMHYKIQKKKISIRCWTFIEASELFHNKEVALELYAKPVDVKRKKLKYFSRDELFLHILPKLENQNNAGVNGRKCEMTASSRRGEGEVNAIGLRKGSNVSNAVSLGPTKAATSNVQERRDMGPSMRKEEMPAYQNKTNEKEETRGEGTRATQAGKVSVEGERERKETASIPTNEERKDIKKRSILLRKNNLGVSLG